MARYTDESQAAADGFRVVHEPERHRYALYLDPPVTQAEASPGTSEDENITRPARLVGEAHYSVFGDEVVDFDHTVVIPQLRGTGIADVLARHALSDDAPDAPIGHRRVAASCWFIAGYLRKHPELLER